MFLCVSKSAFDPTWRSEQIQTKHLSPLEKNLLYCFMASHPTPPQRTPQK